MGKGRSGLIWVNGNYDRLFYDSDDGNNYDDDIQTAPTTDAYYVDPSSGQNAIPTIRDLEDYTRLWMPGLSNLVANLPDTYGVNLQWRNNTGAAIRLLRAAETNGGTNYLFDADTGAAQTNFYNNPCYGCVSSGQKLDLTPNYRLLLGAVPSDYFIFCGAAS